jgi:ATP-dependent helicase/nuclease subunit B
MKERRLAKLKPLDLGLFFHSVLELLFNKLKSNNLSFSTVNSELLGRFVDDSVKKLLVENSFLKNFAARARHNSFIILSAAEVIKDAASELSQIARVGSFAQVACEIGFGDEFSVPAVEIKLDGGEKMHIEGKIDRVDAACKDGRNYALILDYKTSQGSIDFSMLSAGLDLQLPIYLLAVRNKTISGCDGLVPLGAFYFRIQASPRLTDLGGIEKEAGKIKRKPKGFFNGEFFKLIDGKTETGHSPFYSFQITQKDKQFGRYETSSLLTEEHFSGLLSFTENKIKEFGGRMICGAIDVNPYKYGKRIACTYCPYKPLCRFDWQINDYAQVRKISKTEFFGAIE